MVQIEPVIKLVELLRSATLRTRIGLWCMPLEAAGREREIAVQLSVEAVDVRTPLRTKIAPGADYLRLSTVKIIETLDSIASSTGRSDCVLVCNLDLLLSGVTQEQCTQVWEELFNGLPHRSRALLLAIPETATQIMPSDELLAAWRRDNRVAP